MNLFDIYGNQITQYPSGWKLQAYLSDSEIDYANRIEFCQLNNFTFTMCQTNSANPADQSSLTSVQQRWDDLVTNTWQNITIVDQS